MFYCARYCFWNEVNEKKKKKEKNSKWSLGARVWCSARVCLLRIFIHLLCIWQPYNAASSVHRGSGGGWRRVAEEGCVPILGPGVISQCSSKLEWQSAPSPRENLKPQPRTHALFLFHFTTLSCCSFHHTLYSAAAVHPRHSRRRRRRVYTIWNEFKRNSQRVLFCCFFD